MRTTLKIDDDLLEILRRMARELGKPFKQIVNDALRKGLSESLPANGRAVAVRPHDFGEIRAGLDWNRINRLVDDLAVDNYLRKSVSDDSAKC